MTHAEYRSTPPPRIPPDADGCLVFLVIFLFFVDCANCADASIREHRLEKRIEALEKKP